MKLFNVQMPDDLHSLLCLVAAQRDTSASAFVRAAIREKIERDKNIAPIEKAATVERLPKGPPTLQEVLEEAKANQPKKECWPGTDIPKKPYYGTTL